MNTGMTEPERRNVAQVLSIVLASTYTLYLKTQNFHWNVTGPMFHPFHLMFESQYQTLADSLDEIAERIRALGEFAPAGFSQYAALSWLEEAQGVPSAEGMVAELLEDHELMVRNIRESFEIVDDAADEVTADLLIQRLQFHEKTAWMLRSVIEG